MAEICRSDTVLGEVLERDGLERTQVQEDWRAVQVSCRKEGERLGRKRGRPKRTGPPRVQKKTEEKDKYWLRAFHKYMRRRYPCLRRELSEADRQFWEFLLSRDGTPGKGYKSVSCRFASYGKAYKDFIFSHVTYTLFFRSWFLSTGEPQLRLKYEPQSDLYRELHAYALQLLSLPNTDVPDSPLSEPDKEALVASVLVDPF